VTFGFFTKGTFHLHAPFSSTSIQWAPPPTRHSEDGRPGHMGKRSALVELFLGDMGSMQRELRPSIQREDQLTMETKLEQITVKAVNQLPKSVVREIRTPRSVGTGGGRPPPATRWEGEEKSSSLPRPSLS